MIINYQTCSSCANKAQGCLNEEAYKKYVTSAQSFYYNTYVNCRNTDFQTTITCPRYSKVEYIIDKRRVCDTCHKRNKCQKMVALCLEQTLAEERIGREIYDNQCACWTEEK